MLDALEEFEDFVNQVEKMGDEEVKERYQQKYWVKSTANARSDKIIGTQNKLHHRKSDSDSNLLMREDSPPRDLF